MYINLKHKEIVENRGYGYIGTYNKNDILLNKGIVVKNTKRSYLEVKCPYCGVKYAVRLDIFKSGAECDYCCDRYENSFAYYIQVELDESLNKYWDWDKNIVNPYLIYKSSPKNKVMLKCDKVDYHDVYPITCNNFVSGKRCPQCSHFQGNVHPKDSFGALHPNKAKQWDYEKNNISPLEVTSFSRKKVWFNCEDCGTSFERTVSNIQRNPRVLCSKCSSSYGEAIIHNFLEYNNIDFEYQKEFEELIGLRGGQLSYDFYLPKYNLLIEFQGEQHTHYCKGFHKSREDFDRQLKHDQIKFNYAVDNNINILYLYYWEIEEIENKLKYELEG